METNLPGINVLLEGPTGTGKTHAIGTIVDAGIETFVQFTEPGLESLLGYWTDNGKPVPPNVHWNILEGAPGSFETLKATAQTINTYSQEALYKMQDPNRGKHNQLVALLGNLANFPDQRTGERFGAVDTWGPNRCFVVDSLSGINPIALSLVVGGKPVKSQTDWGIAQDQIEKLVRLCCNSKCHFVLIAHVERETDQVFGGVKITVSTLGKALAPKIPPFFSDVILAGRDGAKFHWSTAHPQADLKARNLPIADNITPSFGPLMQKWKSRGGTLGEMKS